MKKMNKKGFTITELVIVIAVIAILAGVMIPTFSGIITTANENKALQQAAAAAKIAFATVMADGEISAAEAAGTVEGIYTFTFDADTGVLLSAVETTGAKYTYTVANGVITKATKA